MGRVVLTGRSDIFHGAKSLVINIRLVGRFFNSFILGHCQHLDSAASADRMIDDKPEKNM
jgi:hypothetical protein